MWYYSYNGKRTGPVSFEEIVRQIQAGVIRPETAVCEVGQKPCRAMQNQKLAEYFVQEQLIGYYLQDPKSLPESSSTDGQWIYSHNCKRTGPVPFEEIIRQVQAGVIRPETTVYEVGQKPARAGQHPLLKSLFETMNRSQPTPQRQYRSGQNRPANSMSFNFTQQSSVPEDQWFLSDNGTNGYGPYSTSQVVAMIQNGQIHPENLAWRNGENAVQISILPMFSGYFGNPTFSSSNINSVRGIYQQQHLEWQLLEQQRQELRQEQQLQDQRHKQQRMEWQFLEQQRLKQQRLFLQQLDRHQMPPQQQEQQTDQQQEWQQTDQPQQDWQQTDQPQQLEEPEELGNETETSNIPDIEETTPDEEVSDACESALTDLFENSGCCMFFVIIGIIGWLIA